MIDKGMGWLPELPSIKDFTPQQEQIQPLLSSAQVAKPADVSTPDSVDLRQWFSEVEDQGQLGSCTANAGVGLVEYFERKAFGNHINASRLFLYKASRNLMQQTGDTGAYLRTTMGALVLFGVPPEDYWPYNIASFDKEPPPFCYAFGQNFRAIKFYRLDPPNTAKDALLARIKANLVANLPSMFGFTVYSSISQAGATGEIPYPTRGEKVEGGHAIVAAGYDDNKKVENRNRGGEETTGALLIRNSWGPDWGEEGYGWLPYEYVLRGLAVDWWSLIKDEWIDTGQFSPDTP
jgi:C1A family cysteine protease